MSLDAFSDRSPRSIHRTLADPNIIDTVSATDTDKNNSSSHLFNAIANFIQNFHTFFNESGNQSYSPKIRSFPTSLKTTEIYFADIAITNFEVVTGLEFDDRMISVSDHDHVMLLQRAGTIGRQLCNDQISPDAAAATVGKLLALIAMR